MAKKDKPLSAIERYRQQQALKKELANKSSTKESNVTTPKKKGSKEKVVNKKKVVDKKKESRQEVIKKASKANPKDSTSALVDKLRGKLSSLQGAGGSGPRFNYVKLERGSNIFRIVEPSSGPLFLFYKRHRGQVRGRFRTVADLSWLVSDDDVVEAMLERDKINEKDLELIQRYGDPYSILFKGLQEAGREQSYSDARIGQKRCMMVIHQDGEFGILDMGITFGESVVDLYASNPSIVSWDNGMSITVKAKGDGLQRKYSQPIPNMGDTGPLEFEIEDDEEPTTPNLYDVLAGNVMHYVDKVQFLFSSHKNLVALAALDVEDFGVSERELSTSFNYGDNAKDEEDLDPDVTEMFKNAKKIKSGKKVTRRKRVIEEEPEEEIEEDEEELEDDEEEVEEEGEEEELEDYDEDEED